MGLLISAVCAAVAAVVESSALTQLLVGGIKPDLVLALAVAAAMMLGFEHAMAWAVVGGLMFDLLLPERVPGATTFALLLVSGTALLAGRFVEPPRPGFVAIVAVALSFLFQALVMVLLAATTGSAVHPVAIGPSLAIALLTGATAGVGASAMRAVSLRFGRMERMDW